MPHRTPIIGGNWKMNTRTQRAAQLTSELAESLNHSSTDVFICPPFPYLLTVSETLEKYASSIKLGAQDCYHQPDGPFTGEVSLGMLTDCGVSHVLVGHSERRHVIHESNALINDKTLAVLEASMTAVLCIGETLDQRDAGQTHTINEQQLRTGLASVRTEHLSHLVIAYEPVWAIGTGKTATPADAQTAHAHIRTVLADMFTQDAADTLRIQYGGSVKPANAAELFAQPDIDGGLIGGASLIAKDFAAIVAATTTTAHTN